MPIAPRSPLVQPKDSSPLFRCVQTAAAAAAALGVNRVRIEPRLAEGMCEEWYRSWGVKDADTTWGGPTHAAMGSPVDPATLHPFATKPASACHGTAPWLKQQLEEQNPELAAKVTVDVASAVASAHAFTWGEFESEADLGPRMRTVFESTCERGVGAAPILLCSHGGPTSKAYSEMTGGKKLEGKVGYTGLFVYLPPDGGEDGAVWPTPVVADAEHLKEVPEGTASGPNDASEQAPSLAVAPVAPTAATEEDDDDDGGGLAALMGGDLDDGDSDGDGDFEAGEEEEDLDIDDASDDDVAAGSAAKRPRVG